MEDQKEQLREVSGEKKRACDQDGLVQLACAGCEPEVECETGQSTKEKGGGIENVGNVVEDFGLADC